MNEYKPIGTEKAREILEEFGKDVVVILAWDEVSNLIHTTTYGREAKHKEWAAEAGKLTTKALGGELSLAQVFEDFHDDYDPARYKEACDLLKLIFRRQDASPQMVQRVEKFLKSIGHVVRQG